MTGQHVCKSDGRREAVRAAKGADGKPVLNGIDFLEVKAGDHKTLDVHFLHPLPGQAGAVPPAPAPSLTRDNVAVEHGVRIQGITVESVHAAGQVLTVTVNAAGDFSTYTLRLVQSSTNRQPPPGFDPHLAQVDFSFKIGCPSDFDCKTETVCPPERRAEPTNNYLAKDYATFRQLMLDRLSLIMPTWKERSPADLQMALVELLAYVGDQLSYYQDAVGTEAYLGTARKRTSVRRHARLLDYFLQDGSNARVWVALEVDEQGDADGATVPQGTRLVTRGTDAASVVDPADLEGLLTTEAPQVFETMHAVTLHSAHNRIRFHTWSDQGCWLPTEATRATLLDVLDASNQRMLALATGDVLVFEEIASPATGNRHDADPSRRCAVRLTHVAPSMDLLTHTPVVEIEWSEDDALPFPLCLSAVVTDGEGPSTTVETTIVRGNIVLADHGLTNSSEPLLPSHVPETAPYHPRLRHAPLTFQGPRWPSDGSVSATSAITYGIRDARPAIVVSGDDGTWTPQYDLLGSTAFSRDFVVEMESDGAAHLRFGDGIHGRRPAAGSVMTATYRVGNGTPGNVGAEAIARIVWTVSGITRVRNPVGATGGVDPESIEHVRQYAPQAFRAQERAVTEADYASIAARSREVQQAAGSFRWTGSWYTAFVTVDRKGGRAVDASFRDSVRQYLERYRLAGYDLEINGPSFVPLHIVSQVCVQSGYFQSDVKRGLLEAFGNRDLPNGKRGFFHPDNFTFGQPVYLSQIYRAAMQVAGVGSVNVTTFQRWGRAANHELDRGVLTTASLEIVQLANDPNFPENGKMEFVMMGGL